MLFQAFLDCRTDVYWFSTHGLGVPWTSEILFRREWGLHQLFAYDFDSAVASGYSDENLAPAKRQSDDKGLLLLELHPANDAINIYIWLLKWFSILGKNKSDTKARLMIGTDLPVRLQMKPLMIATISMPIDRRSMLVIILFFRGLFVSTLPQLYNGLQSLSPSLFLSSLTW